MKIKKIKDPYKEALRYLENAEDCLKKTKVDDKEFYTDYKYVRMAGHTALCGVYLALEPFLPTLKNGKRRQYKDYLQLFPKRTHGKERKYLGSLYQIFHYQMGYDGITNEGSKDIAMDLAKYLIGWAKTQYQRV